MSSSLPPGIQPAPGRCPAGGSDGLQETYALTVDCFSGEQVGSPARRPFHALTSFSRRHHQASMRTAVA